MQTPVALAPISYRWVQRGKTEDAGALTALESALQLPSLLCRLLLRRGHSDVESAKQYLKPRLDRLHDPFLLTDMEAAVNRLERALQSGERILVHGDYDVDGICAATLLTRVLRRLGGQVEPFVPHRMHDGYDLSQAGVRAAANAGATLIVTGDCGIVAHTPIAAAAQLGIDVIVTDHHSPGDVLPAACAIVNPNRADCGYPNPALAGVGVAFKVCQALWARRGLPAQDLWYYLDLVAVATIADLAPLSGENRIMAKYGLRLLSQSHNPGLRALLDTAGLAGFDSLGAGQVSHVLAPRINAVGRMSEASKGVRLLLEDDDSVAQVLAKVLEEENRTRQAVDRETLARALEMLEETYDPARDYAIVLGGEGWHPGVIGIVASRLVERLHRPTILFALDANASLARGSARSIPGFHLFNAVKECSSYLERYGGHKYAAGMDIRPERIAEFRDAFQAVARNRLTPEDLIPELSYDLELPLERATLDLTRLLRHFGPFGVGNPGPIFVARGLEVTSAREVGEGHMKLELRQAGARLSAIGFGMAERLRQVEPAHARIDIAFQLQENYWNGNVELQARLIDVRFSE
ncbi:MAG: single-stranded-DNA-specific exonuclease RecJ [Longimicrobiales bacterium]